MIYKVMIFFLIFTLSWVMPNGFADNNNNITLTGWEIDEKNTEKFIADAAAVGFDVLITWSNNPVFLEKAVKCGNQHKIKIFSSLAPMGGMGKLWNKRYPERPVPWQIMTGDEDAAAKFIAAGKNKYIIPYQFGGEPKMTNEVLETKIICLNNQEARALFKPIIDEILAVPGIEGLAFDGFGYQNYHRCYCGECQKLLTEYCNKHPEMTKTEVESIFFRDTLVDYINYLADYARSRKADIKTAIHIWPVFVPEPLYGNRLNIDFCGQTAAWYTLWPIEKIAEYSRIISGGAAKYYQRQHGVGMIGYYDKPGKFPVKDAIRVDMELKTMLENGCREIQVCGAKDVINNQEIAAVFKKYFK
jgi:hypothetical protein